MAKILLTADRSLIGNYREEGLDYLTTASPSSIPHWFFKFLFFPAEKPQYTTGYVQGIPVEAPYGLRKIEAKLLQEDLEAITVDSEYLEHFIAEADVLGIYVMDPFGLGPLPATCSKILRTKELSLNRYFRAILENPEIKKAKKRGLTIFVGGPGAWQFRYKKVQDEYGVDCVIEGEAEKIIGDFVRKALRGENLPRFYEVCLDEIPTVDEIPEIRSPSSNGLIEIGRGCPRGCQFCTVTLKPLRWYPLEKIERELKVNSDAGLRTGILHAEDVLLYGSNTLIPNREKVLRLHKLAKKYVPTIGWTNISISSVAQNSKLIENLSDLLLDDDQKWWGTDVGLETGSPRIAKSLMSNMIKPFKPENWHEVVQRAAKIMADNKLFPTYTLIINLPEETEEDIISTIELVDSLRDFPSLILPYIFIPLREMTLKDHSRLSDVKPLQQELLIECYKHDLKWSKNLLDLYFADKMIGWFFKDIFKLHIPSDQIVSLERPVKELKELLDRRETNESEYQKSIKKYPWILGAQFVLIQDHRKLNDENIPDFTALRARDGFSDIIEIKQPFTNIFRQDGNFTSDFNDTWNQIERYLNFAREEKDYLRRKGLNFENPRCYLIVGYNIPPEELKKIKTKERLNPSIEVITYNDLLAYAKKTIEFLENLRSAT
jgi:radical SAM superfamily enzyme YgiQ (UPF0313 family)